MNKLILYNEEFDIAAGLKPICEIFRKEAETKGLDLEFVCEPKSGFFYGDKVRMSQLLVNLLSNAIKYSKKGKITARLQIESGTLKITVSDQGIGIPEHRIAEIFEPFHQLEDPYTKEHGGIGAGLSIVKSISELMGGTIEVDSKVGSGTYISVTTPRKTMPALTDRIEGKTNGYPERPRREVRTVLIVEDEAVNRLYVKSILEKNGYKALEAVNGILAVEAASLNPPDLIFMDVGMPNMNGMEATKILRSMDQCKNVPIIGLTAHAYGEEQERFIMSGMDFVITKPFTEASLIEAIARCSL